MATRTVPLVPLEDELGEGDRAVDAALQRPWRKAGALSRGPELAERFLESASFDRAPWLTVAFAGGIAAWFVLPNPITWILWLGGWLIAAIGAIAIWRGDDAIRALQHHHRAKPRRGGPRSGQAIRAQRAK